MGRAIFTEQLTAQVKGCAKIMVNVVATQELEPGDVLRRFKEEIAQDAALAQLIADSTEKKFKLNSLFKGMWKKKHYSFDLS